MFVHKIKQLKISNNIYKDIHYFYIIKQLKNLLIKNEFSLFFFYSFLTKNSEFELKKILQQENLECLKIKKQIIQKDLKKLNLLFLNNLLQNNSLIIYNKLNKPLNQKTLQQLLTIKEISFLGGLYKNQFYRPFEFDQIFKYSLKNVQLNLYKIITYPKLILQKLF